MDKDYEILLDALGFEPAGVDLLVERTGLRADEVASMLLILELEGRIESYPGGLYVRHVQGGEMKESVLDILIYLFENYFDADIESAPEPDRDTLKDELERAGFSEREVERALEWLEQLSADPQRVGVVPTSRAIRVFDPREQARLDTECRGYIMYLENIGILNAASASS